MDNPIQTGTYKRLYKALECKDTTFFLACIKSCALTHSQLLALKAGALKVGCDISVLVAIQNKINQTPVMSIDSKKTDTQKSKQQGTLPIKKNHSGSNWKIEIIAFRCDFLQYCIFDKTPLHLDKNLKIDTHLTCPGYQCPTCNSLYVHYKYLPSKEKQPIKGKKPKSNISVRDIVTVNSRIHPLKKNKKGMPGFSTTQPKKDKIALKPSVIEKKAVYVSPELPPVCKCNSKVFDYTKKFSLANSSVTFSGKYCSECKKCFITTETFNSLSPKAQCMIERKAVTWIKHPNTQINKAIPKAPPPPPRLLFWWEKEIRAQGTESLSINPSLQGKGKQILQVSYGIDFGASTTKVIVRTKLGDNNPTWRALIFGAHFVCEEYSDNTLVKSQIYISDEGKIGLGKEGLPGWNVKQYFKAVLVNAKNPKQDLDEVYYAIFYIATILKTIQEHLKKAYPPAMYSKIELNITMGMPIRGMAGPLATVFTNILQVSDELKENRGILLSDGIDFVRWKALCKASHSQQKLPKPYLSVRPELYSEVVGLFTSSYGPTHRALVIDVGSATLDIAFVYTEPPIQPFLYIPIAEVASLGVEVVASSLVSNNPTVFSTLHEAREYLITYPQKKVDDKALRELVQELFRSCILKIKRAETEVFGHALIQPIIPVYFYGGGRDAKWYKGKIKNLLNSVQTDIAFNVPFAQLEAIPRVPSKLLPRFQVALGLSNNGKEEMPLRSLPKDHETWWKEPPHKEERRYVDLEELQKNLYGN